MFEGPNFPKSLDETLFETWLENGRAARIGYSYLLIVWDDFESDYQPVYVEQREEMDGYIEKRLTHRESLVAAYDLYSESRII